MDAKKIAQYMNIASLAIALGIAERSERSLKLEYHSAWARFEGSEDEEGRYCFVERITRENGKKWDAALEETKPQYLAYQEAKKETRRAKRRLSSALRKA